MAGTVKHVLDAIIAARGKGNPALADATRAKLILKGINPAKFTESTPDDPATVGRAKAIAAEFGVRL